MWKILKQLIGNKKNQSSFKEIKFDDELVVDSNRIVNRLNEYFIASIRNIVNNINSNPNLTNIINFDELTDNNNYNFIDINQLISAEQSGFQKNHSCETTLQHSLINWRKNLDEGLFTGVIFVDFARAFETICRKKLLKKLYTMGLRNTVLKWFESYLMDRYQRVKFQGVFSDEQKVEFGVPQGSKLGPVLFNIYLNEIISVLKKEGVDIKLFADDLMISVRGLHLNIIENKLNDCLKKLYCWINNNQLKINIKKTVMKVIHDQRIKNIRNNFRVVINDHELKYVTETKYLGIIIDDNLNFKQNADYISKKI
ncbi:GSCOCG00012117001-RA-CDS, partial [Cotesia congregata]